MQSGRGMFHEGKKYCVKSCTRAINCRTRRPEAGVETAGLAIPVSAFSLLDNTDKLSSQKNELIQALRDEYIITEITKSRDFLTWYITRFHQIPGVSSTAFSSLGL